MAVKEFSVIPRRWRGVRNVESEILLEPDEWADSRNFDSRYGWSAPGSTLLQTLPTPSLNIVGLTHFFDKDGNLKRIVIATDGTIFLDNVAVSGQTAFSASQSITDKDGKIPGLAAGAARLFIARGTDSRILHRDPIDNVWKTLDAGPKAKTLTLDPAGPRLFVSPDSTGQPDTWAWSAVGDFTKWLSADGGGEEPIGEDRNAITVIRANLENNLAIYKSSRIYIRDGSDPAKWRLINTSNDIGSIAPLSVINIGKGQGFVHESGFYLLNAIGAVSFPALTERVQETWDNMLKNFGDYLRFAHASYNAREQTIYLWIPNQASRIMNLLLKIYLGNGSITIHDDKVAGASDYFPQVVGKLTYAEQSKTFDIAGLTNDGTAITSKQTTGIFSGSPPTPQFEKKWGERGKLYLFFDMEGATTVKVTPRTYRENGRVDGVQQSFALAAGQANKIKVNMPDAMGWGTDFLIEATSSAGRWRLVGYAGQYDEVTDT